MIVGPCTIITGGPNPNVIEEGGVHVVGAHIAHVAHASTLAAAYPEETLWPGQGRVLMPGLVNTHAHLSRHLARGLGDLTPGDWRRYDDALSPEDVYWASLASLVEGLRHGVTTVFDFHRSSTCIDLSLSEVVAAASEAGARVATCYGVSSEDGEASRRAALEECASFANELRIRRQGTLRAMLGIQASDLASIDRLLREALDATPSPVGVHIDLASEGAVHENASLWFGDPVPALWAHADRAPRSVLGLARERGDALSVVATRDAPGGVALDAGWGSDAGLHAPPTGKPAGGSQYRRLFVHGAAWAARYFGEGAGTLTPGAPADFIMCEYRPATELAARTLDAHLETGLLRAPVTGVMVAGEVVMDGGRLTTIDEAEVAARARESARRIWERVE